MIGQEHAPVEICYGTTRVLRVRQIGQIYLLENLQVVEEVERWLPVAKSDGPDARDEIIMALRDANINVERMLCELKSRTKY